MTLLESTIEMIKLANEKGYQTDHEISPVMFESWMNAEEVFCNTACSVIAMWLRQKHRIIIMVVPYPVGDAMGHKWAAVHLKGKFADEMEAIPTTEIYEKHWLAAIEWALKKIK